MNTANNFKPSSNMKTEKIEYKLDEKNYLISLIYNSEEIAFNIKSRLPLQYEQFESKFNLSDMKTMNQFFAQFTNIEKIAGLYSNLFKNKKINISEEKDELNLSFMNITDDIINLSIKKKEFAGDEKYDKLLDIMKSLINEIKELKSENKKMKEQIDELTKFKLEIEEEREKKKYYSLKDSNILNDPEKIKMISDWINPNKKIIYNQIYKATRDGGTGKNFHTHCDNKGPTLTLINSTNGYIFGGFISISWEGPQNWTYKSNDDSAFIFSIDNKIKYPIKDKSCVIYNQINYGPDFGSNDIFLSKENFLNNNSNQCNCYKYYNASPEKLSGGTTFQVKELEVYSVKIE